MEWLIVVVAVIAVVGGYVIAMYNKMIGLSRRVEEGRRDIQHQMKQRYDAIAALLELVRPHLGNEHRALRAVTEARGAAMDERGGAARRARAESDLRIALRDLLGAADDHPGIRADPQFLSVQKDLTEAETGIGSAMRFYNGNVRALNATVESFPSNVVARRFSFRTAEPFQLDQAGP